MCLYSLWRTDSERVCGCKVCGELTASGWVVARLVTNQQGVGGCPYAWPGLELNGNFLTKYV